MRFVPGPLSPPGGAVCYKGDFIPGRSYRSRDLAISGVTTAVANKYTLDDPAPHIVGDEEEIIYPTPPSFSTGNETVSVIITGMVYVPSTYKLLSQIVVYLPDNTSEYSIWLASRNGGVTSNIEQLVGWDTFQNAGKNTFDISSRILVPGDRYLLALAKRATGGVSTFAGDWDQKNKDSGNPDQSSGEMWWSTSGDMLFSYDDQGGSDRSADLNTVVTGTEIVVSSSTYTVQDVTQNGWGIDCEVTPTSGRGGEGVKTFTFNTPTAASQDYFFITNHVLGNAEQFGYFDDGTAPATENDNGYGVDFIVVELAASPDWDIISFDSNLSSVGGGGGSSGTGLTLANISGYNNSLTGLDYSLTDSVVRYATRTGFLTIHATLEVSVVGSNIIGFDNLWTDVAATAGVTLDFDNAGGAGAVNSDSNPFPLGICNAYDESVGTGENQAIDGTVFARYASGTYSFSGAKTIGSASGQRWDTSANIPHTWAVGDIINIRVDLPIQ